MTIFWVFAHEPQQSIVMKHIIIAAEYELTVIIVFL